MTGLWKAIFVGTMAGATPFLLFSIPVGLIVLFEGIDAGHADLGMLWLAILPVVLTLCVVAPASVILGLPVSWLLDRWHRETIESYVAIGGALGFLVAVALVAILADSWGWVWLGLVGTFSGAFTAYSWAKSRLGEWDRL